MPSDANAGSQWERVAAELRACREAQQRAWGDIDNTTLGRYLADEVSREEREQIESALDELPELRKLTDLVRDVLGASEAVASDPVSVPYGPAILPFPQAQPLPSAAASRSPAHERRRSDPHETGTLVGRRRGSVSGRAWLRRRPCCWRWAWRCRARACPRRNPSPPWRCRRQWRCVARHSPLWGWPMSPMRPALYDGGSQRFRAEQPVDQLLRASTPRCRLWKRKASRAKRKCWSVSTRAI